MIEAPATYADYLALLEALGIERPLLGHRCIPIQIAAGSAWAWRAAPSVPPAALGGIVHGPDESEAWFSAGVGADQSMLRLVRRFRVLLARERRLIGRPIVARVSRQNPAGERMARASGLTPKGAADGAVRLWSTG